MEINQGIKNIIESNAMGFATTDKNGNPHNIAVGFAKVISKDEIIITNNYLNETINNISKNNNVSLVVWQRDWEENCVGYELKGTAQYFTSGKWADFIKKIPINKEEPCKGAILIKINKIKHLI
ncbi:MAG: pyridoxamine 5'-phosphate oxidase family protein [Candidatus Pacearchaeota archaeon]|jgi:predicted pyridoxine 5'-phosphate oxidase superfamily flavin-nucleotide-binding protein